MSQQCGNEPGARIESPARPQRETEYPNRESFTRELEARR